MKEKLNTLVTFCTKSQNRIFTRNQFLKISALGFGALVLPSCNPVEPLPTRTQIYKLTPVKATGTPQPKNTVEFSTPIRTVTPTPLPERLATMEPTKGWERPSIEKRMALLANPKFYTEPQGPSGIIFHTPQQDTKQYGRLDPQYLKYLESYKSLSCSEAVMATILKICTYFKTGDVPDVTIADVINYLMDKNYQGYHFIWPNNPSMQDLTFIWAMDAVENLGKETDLYTVTGLTPNWGLDNPHIVPVSEWSGYFHSVNKGELAVARVLKYGNPPGSVGHFITIGSFNSRDEPLIVDSMGSQGNGDARTIALASYVERVQPGVPLYENQPGFLWMAKVVPTF